MAWVTPSTVDIDRDRIIGAGGGERVHAIEYGWLDAMRTVRLYAYRLPAEPVGDLFAVHEAASIQLRVLAHLRPFWQEVIASTVGFGGIRLRSAALP